MFRRSPQKMSETFEQLLEESLKGSVMQTGAVISAEVVDVNGDYVVVNAGLKSESEIPATQFRDADGAVSVQVGDFVKVGGTLVNAHHTHTYMLARSLSHFFGFVVSLVVHRW